MTKDIEAIYQELLNEIVTLRIKPGERLKEVEVSEHFSVSRTPIRDVLKRLEMDKLLDIYSHNGSFVTRIDLHGISDIMYVRSVVEEKVCLSLMEHVTPLDIAELRDLIKSQSELLENNVKGSDEELASSFFRLDNAFHHEIYKKAGQENVLDLLNSSFPYFTRYRFLTFFRDESDITNLFEIHQRFVDVFEKKDCAELKKLVYEHNFSGLNGIEKVKLRHPDYFVDEKGNKNYDFNN